jgi:hypothetical protein
LVTWIWIWLEFELVLGDGTSQLWIWYLEAARAWTTVRISIGMAEFVMNLVFGSGESLDDCQNLDWSKWKL